MSELGVGIVGTGQRCMFFFGPYLKAHPGRARLVALADHDRARLQSAAEDLEGDVETCSSIDDMLQLPKVDAVIITTPDFTHRQMLECAHQAGKSVLCEKPMATTIEDALAMTERALASESVVQLGFMLRYAPFFAMLKDLLASGAIGPLVHVSAAEVVEYYHGASFFRRWHRFRRNSGGLLVHKACHSLDAINWLVDASPVWVSASGGIDTFVPKSEAAARCRDCSLAPTCPGAYRVDDYNWVYRTRSEREAPRLHASDMCSFASEKDSIDNAVISARYDNGVRLAFSFATTGARHERHLLLVGQNGQIHASQADGTIVVEPVAGEPQTLRVAQEYKGEHGGGDEPLISSFLQCVASKTQPVADIRAGLYSALMGIAATQSIDLSGRRIDLGRYVARFGER